MGVDAGNIVYLDTNTILEAHRVRIWAALTARLKLATSTECVKELKAGNYPGGGHVIVDIPRFHREVSIGRVELQAAAETALAGGFDVTSLDPGEKDLLALVRTKEGAWCISSHDRGCIRAGKTLQILDRFVSLEALAEAAGVRPRIPFYPHFTKRWLADMRSRAIMGTL